MKLTRDAFCDLRNEAPQQGDPLRADLRRYRLHRRRRHEDL